MGDRLHEESNPGDTRFFGVKTGHEEVSVFDTDHEGTQVVGEEEELDPELLRSDGVIDLTRESDDTPLCAELLEEVYSGDADLKKPAHASELFESVLETVEVVAQVVPVTAKRATKKRTRPQRSEEDAWLIRLAFLVPKKNREGWLGDLLEDRSEMLGLGFSRFRIETMTASQVLNFVLLRPGIWITAAAAWAFDKIKFF